MYKYRLSETLLIHIKKQDWDKSKNFFLKKKQKIKNFLKNKNDN